MKYIRTIKKIMQMSELLDSEANGSIYVEDGKLSLRESKIESVNKIIVKNSIVFLINDYHYMFKSWKHITKDNNYYYWKHVFYISTLILSILLMYFAVFKQIHPLWFVIPSIILYILKGVIDVESNEITIKKMRKIDPRCNDLENAKLVWLEYNFGCSSKFIDKIELLENNSRIYKKYKTDLDLRPSIFKINDSKTLIPLISAIVSIIITFVAKLDFSLPVSDVFNKTNIYSFFQIIPIFVFVALFIYILIYGFMFIIKIGFQFITIFFNSLDGYNSMSQIRVNQLITALRKHTTIVVKSV